MTALSSAKVGTKGAVEKTLSGPVWTGSRSGDRIHPNTVYHAWVRLRDAAGLPKMTLHQFRHGTATLLVAKGVHMRDVAEILGHADRGVTAAKTYVHVSEASKRSAMDVLDEAIG